MVHPDSFGNELDYYVIEGFLNGFHQFRPSHILAARLYGLFTPEDTPYSDLSSLGRRADLRGYVSGEHIANNLITLQLEYRYQMTQQWALVGFVGQAALFDNDDLNGDDFYASAGGGIRYRLSKQRPVNLRVDFAIGEGGSSGFYVGLSEAF